MSSLGYALTFLLCSSDGAPCEVVAVRAERFATVASCQAAAADALRTPQRSQIAERRTAPVCQSLDRLCGATVSFVPSREQPWRLTRTDSLETAATRTTEAAAAVLALICQAPSPGDCL